MIAEQLAIHMQKQKQKDTDLNTHHKKELKTNLGLVVPFRYNIKDTMKVKVKSLSCVRLFATPWTVAYQAPPSTGFSRQEYWSRLPFSSPGDLPNPGIEPRSPAFQEDALTSEPPGKP